MFCLFSTFSLNVDASNPQEELTLHPYVIGEVVSLQGLLQEDDDQGLIVELNGVEITELVSTADSILSFTLGEDLQPGKQQLIISRQSPDGSLEEIKNLHFDLYKSSWWQDYAVDLAVDVDFTQRLGQDLASRDDNWADTDASVRLNAFVARQKFRAEMSTDYAYVDDLSRSSTDKHFDMDSYEVRAQYDLYQATVGHVRAPGDNFLVQGISDRGITLEHGDEDSVFNLGFFAISTIGATGDKKMLPLEKANRLDGVVTQLSSPSGNHTLSAAYVRGKKTAEDWWGNMNSETGNDKGLSYQGAGFDQQLTFTVERAWTMFDADGTGTEYSPEKANAVFAEVSFVPEPNYDKPDALEWDFRYEYSRALPKYNSIANASGSPDSQDSSAALSLRQGDWNSSFDYSISLDNILLDDDNPQVKSVDNGVNWNWSPDMEDSKLTALGSPEMSLGWQQSRQTNSFLPVALSDWATNSKFTNVSMDLGSRYDHWGWDYDYSQGHSQDLLDNANDSKDKDRSIQLNFAIPDTDWSFDVGYSRSRSLQLSDQSSDFSTDRNLGISWNMLDVQMNLNLSRSKSWDSQNTSDRLDDAFSLSANWQSDTEIPFDLSLTGSWNNSHDYIYNEHSLTYEWYLTISMPLEASL